MLTDAQKRHFEAFGYVFLRQLFDAQEMARLMESFDHTVTAACDERDEPQDQNLVDKVETTPDLCWLLEEGRLLDGITDLAGPGFIWCGSECNVTMHGSHPWHADRFGSSETEVLRVKVMIYLDETRADHGCLRVLPGSHRDPYHTALEPLLAQDAGVAERTLGVSGEQVPGVFVEATPGDVLFFNHTLWHGVFHGFPGRRFIALKFAEHPSLPAHVESLDRYSGGTVFRPHPALVEHRDPRLRGMVDGLAEMAAS